MQLKDDNQSWDKGAAEQEPRQHLWYMNSRDVLGLVCEWALTTANNTFTCHTQQSSSKQSDNQYSEVNTEIL